jgi:integrase/recombinase XerD
MVGWPAMAIKKGFTFRPLGNEKIELFRSGQVQGAFDLIYWHPHALQRHKAAPLFSEREQFILHMLRHGSSRASAQRAAEMLRTAIVQIPLYKLREMSLPDIGDTIEKIWGQRLSTTSTFAGHHSACCFRGIFKQFLRFHGKFKLRRSPIHASDRYLNAFDKFNRSRNLTTRTVESHREKVAAFLRWLSIRKKNLRRLGVVDMDQFIAAKQKHGWATATLSSNIRAIRVFTRFAHTRGWCSDIADGIKAPYNSRFTVPSQARDWSEVERLLAATNGSDHAAIRAKAVLTLISTYALRSSEIARLLVSDFDWKKTTLTVRRSKRGRQQRLPLPPDVRRAVLMYMRIRPRCSCRNLFVTLRPLFRPIGKRSFYDLIANRLKGLGITSGRLGPHSIRHARVMQLLREGTPIQEIGDFLGQRHPESPLFYAKFNVELLREVADFRLEGLV